MKDFYVKPELVVAETDEEFIVFEPPKMPFWQKLLIYCSIWLVLTFIVSVFTHSVCKQYAAAQPETAITSYMSLAKQEIFFDAISSAMPGHDNKYEPTYSTAGRIANMYTSPLSFAKLSNEFTEENPVYIIKHNGENMFKVTLEYGDPTGFMKFRGYRVMKTELVNENLLTLNSYNVVFSSDSFVFINERKLDSQLTGVFEMFDVFGNNNYYGIVLKDMLLEPKIMVQRFNYTNYTTTTLDCKRVDDYFIFPYKGGELHTVKFSAPSGATVKIGDKEVSDFFITSTEIVNGVEMSVYTVPTVYGEQPVTAYINEKEVEVTVIANENLK